MSLANAIASTQSLLDNDKLFLILLGCSGAGKSSAIGTTGEKTLYLFMGGEDHGASAASSLGGEILPVWLEKAGGPDATPDTTYQLLLDYLNDHASLKKLGIGTIAIDSATELEALIKSTKQWVEGCTTAKGAHDGFKEKDVTIGMLRKVAMALKSAARACDIHVVVTCPIDVRKVGDMGEVEEAAPRLTGYAVAESLIQMFNDVAVIGRMTKDGVVKHKLQFMCDVEKLSKDQSGRVKKAINFNPRITGVKVEDLPPFMDADLAKLAEFKANRGA